MRRSVTNQVWRRSCGVPTFRISRGTWPHTRPSTLETFRGLPEDDVAAMLGGNAADFYGFDLPQLDKIGARVGPNRASFVS